MTKSILTFAACTLLLMSCSKNISTNNDVIADENSNPVSGSSSQRKCYSQEMLLEQIAADPSRKARLDAIDAIAANPIGRLLPDGTIEIPVVVNVLYRTAAENVSLAQIQSQIDVLNEDFSATNADYNNTPSIFQGVRAGNTGIRFVLDQVIRKSTTKTSWRTNDDMKKANRGGIAPTSPTTKLNMWVCTLSGGILGYAQFPGGSSATDGVVILNTGFGRTGTAAAPFGLGRTATHEVGHWLNLRHIWGDATCGSDLVGDTPTHNTSNGGCPAYPHLSTCAGNPVEMTMNYMDYTYDACMFMFSAGQKTRMLATFAVGGGRNSFAQP